MIWRKIRHCFGGVRDGEEIHGVGGRDIALRALKIYLPPDYDPGREHALLLALDGQTMPRWRLGETLHDLVGRGLIEPAVVVAVPASARRLDEYGTAGTLDFKQRGAQAEAFQLYLRETVLPLVRQRVTVSIDPARNGIFGASMGGLGAFDAAWRRPDVFGCAGVFSGALWWRSDNSSPAAQQASRMVHRRVRETTGKPPLRLWFQAGTEDEVADRDDNGVIDAIQDTTELMDELARKGFHRGGDMEYLESRGGRHHEPTWAEALPEFLRWVLPPRG